MTTSTTTLTLDSDATKGADLHSRLRTLCSDAGLHDPTAFQLTLVIIEAVNNSIEHGYRNEPGHPITVHWRCLDDSADIEIRDRGRPIPDDILDAAMPSPFDEHGRGRSIIREWTDSARYDRIGDENVLYLTRRR